MTLKLDIDPHDICRICMSQNNSLLNYYSNIVVDGYIISVPDMVFKCLNIESDPNDGLPDKMCHVCKQEITNFHLFKEKSARTEQILLAAFNKPIRKGSSVQSKPTSTVATQTDTCWQTEEVDPVDDGLIEEIPEREMKLEDPYELDDDIEEMHTEMEDSLIEPKLDDQFDYAIEVKPHHELQCEGCSKTYTNIEDWQNHKCSNEVIVHVVNEVPEPPEPEEISDDLYEELIHEEELLECVQCHEVFNSVEEYTTHCDNDVHYYNCQQCDLSFSDKETFQAHNAKHHEDHTCLLCQKRFKTLNTFNQHQKLHNSIELVIDYLDCFSCEECHFVFILEKQLATHVCVKRKKNNDGCYIDESCTDYQYLQDDSDYFCDVCSKEYPNLSMAKQHMVIHLKQFVCPFEDCGCTYEIWSRFAMHLSAKHLNEEKHQCRFCELKCASFDLLQDHCKNKCPEKKFKCDHCEKSYFSQKALNLHIKDITKGKTFSCTICKKSFNRRGELELHNRSHTNERPYKCTVCGKAYKTSSMRAAHMDAHINGKTFPCTMCDKKLQTRTSYRNHMKRHTEEKKHECEHCGKKFFTKFHVKLHASKIHEKAKKKVQSEIIFENVDNDEDSIGDDEIVVGYS